MKNKLFVSCFLLIGCFLLTRCNKTGTIEAGNISAYTNLAVGKFVMYKLDSTVTLPFGVGFAVHSYLVKDTIDGMVTDNLNRSGFHIVRFTYDSTTHQWNNSNTFMAILTGKTFEYIENNQRQTRLVNPVAENFSWQGNSYIGSSPFNFVSNDDNFLSWTFTYRNVGQPFTAGNKRYDSTLTVVQFDSTTNKPFYVNSISNYSKGYEVYAKGIGKVFQDLFSWEYQTSYVTRNCLLIHCAGNKCDTTKISCESDGTTNGISNNCDSITAAQASQGVRVACDTVPGNFTYNGYGVRLTMVNHN